MLINIHPDNPDPRKIAQVVKTLQAGGVIIYPTDAVYCIGCDLSNAKALEKVARIKKVKLEKANFSLICSDLSNLSKYTKPLSSSTFRLMRSVLPGPFTFILNASTVVPKYFHGKKKTVGIRVPNNVITQTIVETLGGPLVSTSVHDDDEILEYTTDPELIHERYENLVDIVIDGGIGNLDPTTVVNCTDDDFEIIRQGLGELPI